MSKPDADAVASLLGELLGAPAGQAASHAGSAYRRWCEASGVPVGEEQTLLRYLESHKDRWSFSTCRTMASAAAAVALADGDGDPRGQRYAAYMAAYRRAKGSDVQFLAPPLTREQLVTAARTALLPTEEHLRLRALVAVCDRLGVSPWSSRSLAPVIRSTEGLYIGSDGLTPDGERPGRAGDRFGLLTSAERSLVTSCARRPLARPGVGDGPGRYADTAALRRAWAYANPGRERPHLLNDASPGEALWFIRFVDPHYTRRIRDLAYLLVGWTTGLRNHDLAQLRPRDLTLTPTGYRFQTVEKGHRISAARGNPRAPMPRALEHLATPGDCPVHCSACAVDDLLDVKQRMGEAPEQFLFSLRGRRPLETFVGTNILRRLVPGNPGEAAVSTRSLRVGCVSDAYARGLTLQYIADNFTDHQDLDTTTRYVREASGRAAPTVLPLECPAGEGAAQG